MLRINWRELRVGPRKSQEATAVFKNRDTEEKAAIIGNGHHLAWILDFSRF